MEIKLYISIFKSFDLLAQIVIWLETNYQDGRHFNDLYSLFIILKSTPTYIFANMKLTVLMVLSIEGTN